jgi:hypothetical protein
MITFRTPQKCSHTEEAVGINSTSTKFLLVANILLCFD